MGQIEEEFDEQLRHWDEKYRGQPRRQMLDLFLLSLEREQIVSVAYRESLVADRLEQLQMSTEMREIIRQALLWIWKDEEMHTIYIRGTLIKLGGFWLRMRTLFHVLSGAIGGWTSSVSQTLTWRHAPLSRALAAAITLAGRLTGQVSGRIQSHIRYMSFHEYCLFNLDCEVTAERCWRRIKDLAAKEADITPDILEEFGHIELDEKRHAQVFEILAGTTGDRDQPAPDLEARTLAARLRAISPLFAPTAGEPSLENPVGAGGDVFVTEASPDVSQMDAFRRHLEAVGLSATLAAASTRLGRPVASLRVVIKTAFMLGYHKKDFTPVTDPKLIEYLVDFMRELGVQDITVVENRTLYDTLYKGRSVQEVARYHGYAPDRYRLVDLSAEQEPHAYSRGMALHSIGQSWARADVRIVFGKMKSHPVELVHLNLGNLDSMGTPADRYLFAERQAQLATSRLMVLSDFPPHLALLDAFGPVADGLAGVLGCPRPQHPRRFYGGADALAVDLVAARHIGVTDPRSSPGLRAALHWFGDPRPRTTVRGPDIPIPGWRHPHISGWSRLLSLLAYPMYQFGSGRGSLFVPEMDEDAFPPTEPPSRMVRTTRRFLQHLLGIAF